MKLLQTRAPGSFAASCSAHGVVWPNASCMPGATLFVQSMTILPWKLVLAASSSIAFAGECEHDDLGTGDGVGDGRSACANLRTEREARLAITRVARAERNLVVVLAPGACEAAANLATADDRDVHGRSVTKAARRRSGSAHVGVWPDIVATRSSESCAELVVRCGLEDGRATGEVSSQLAQRSTYQWLEAGIRKILDARCCDGSSSSCFLKPSAVNASTASRMFVRVRRRDPA